jgi:hypothetical protein
MKTSHIKPLLLRSALAGALLLGASACEIDQLSDPNNPGIDLVEDAALSEIQNLVSGIESGMRNRLSTYFDNVGVIGREYWRFSGSDPRFTSDLLGEGDAVLDDNTFYTTGPYADAYRVIKNANLLIEAVEKTKADLTAAQKSGLAGYAKTIKAHQLLLVLNLQYESDIRTEVADPDNLGPFRSKDEALADIAALLDAGASDLGSQATAIPVISTLSNNTANLKEFNRALAARVAVYRSNFSGALTALGESFFSMSTPLDSGVYYFFSTAGGDVVNPMFLRLNNSGENRIAHPSFVADAEAGDLRLDKVVRRDATAVLGTSGLSGDYDVWTYRSLSDGIPIVRNEELLLIYAEANIHQNNMSEAVNALNKVRNAAGLANYSGAMTQDALIDEMLHQRRYSLYNEGHRWIDMRRYGRLDELPIDRPNDDVWTTFPRPANEG